MKTMAEIRAEVASHRRWWRNLRRRARRDAERRIREIEARLDNDVHVDPCPECGSTQLCRSECVVAPWNMEP